MSVKAVLIEPNRHLRDQLAEAVRRTGFTLAACYDWATLAALTEIAVIGPQLVIFPMMQGHSGQWRLVRQLQTAAIPPVLMALSPVDIPAIRQSALAEGVHHVFDPLLEVDGFLAALAGLAQQMSDVRRQQVA